MHDRTKFDSHSPPLIHPSHQSRQCGHQILLERMNQFIGNFGTRQDQLTHRQAGLVAGCSVGFRFVATFETMTALGELFEYPLEAMRGRVFGAE